jgi:tetratricopeptide (TPR) repeat protein
MEEAIIEETNMVQTFEAFSRQDPTFDAPLQEWVSRSPKSYPAHPARAEFLDREGWNARGGRVIDETSDEQIQRMNDYFAASEKEAQSALVINPKLAEAYAVVIGQARTSGRVADCMRTNDAALKQVPASFAIRRATMSCLRPRWGGSYEAMDLLAKPTEPDVHENPQLAALKGFAALDRGEILGEDKNYDAAIAYYTRAIAEGVTIGAFTITAVWP